MRCYTKYVQDVIPPEQATKLYEYLRDNIEWEDGIRSRNGFTRKAKALSGGDNYYIDDAIRTGIQKITNQQYAILGIYLNYYENGLMYTPNHSHKGTHQFVLSLGATRVLKVGKKDYSMTNGGGIIFGSSTHGVPKDPTVMEGRISIATFMVPIETKISPVTPTTHNETDEEMAIRLQMMEYTM